jgi:hypothetical protein
MKPPAIPPQYFFIIGAMKAGTTSLFKYLADHPDLCPSSRKEPKVFRDAGRPGDQLAALRALFQMRNTEPWCFEASTAYTKYPRFSGVPARIREAVPGAMFIYLVRNPVERSWSQYVHNLAHGRERLSFEEALKKRRVYLDISRYHRQLQQYYDVFPRESVLVQVFEEMIVDPAATVKTVCEFLHVDPMYRPPSKDVAFNASTNKVAASVPLKALAALGMERMLPGHIRRRLRTGGSPLPRKSAVLTPELRARVADAVRADTEAFLSSFGRPIEAWSDFAQRTGTAGAGRSS